MGSFDGYRFVGRRHEEHQERRATTLFASILSLPRRRLGEGGCIFGFSVSLCALRAFVVISPNFHAKPDFR